MHFWGMGDSKIIVKNIESGVWACVLVENVVKIFEVDLGQANSFCTEWYQFPSRILGVVEKFGFHLFFCQGKGFFRTDICENILRNGEQCTKPVIIQEGNLIFRFEENAVKICEFSNGISICCRNEDYWLIYIYLIEETASFVKFTEKPTLRVKLAHRTDLEEIPVFTSISNITLKPTLFSKLFSPECDQVILVGLRDGRILYFPVNTFLEDSPSNAKLLCCLNQPVKDIFVYNFTKLVNVPQHQAVIVIGVHGRVIIFTETDSVAVDFLHIPGPIDHITSCASAIISYDGTTSWKTVLTMDAVSDRNKKWITKSHVNFSVPTFNAFAAIAKNNDENSIVLFLVRDDCELRIHILPDSYEQTADNISNIKSFSTEKLVAEIHQCSNILESLLLEQEKQKQLLKEMSAAANFFHSRHQCHTYFNSTCEVQLESRDNRIYLILRVKITYQGPIALIGPHWHLILLVSPSKSSNKYRSGDGICRITKSCLLPSGFGIQETIHSHVTHEIDTVHSLCSQLPLHVSCHLQYSVPKGPRVNDSSTQATLFNVHIASHLVDALHFAQSTNTTASQPEFNEHFRGLVKSLEKLAREYKRISVPDVSETSHFPSRPKSVNTCLTIGKRHVAKCLNISDNRKKDEKPSEVQLLNQLFHGNNPENQPDKLFGNPFEMLVVDSGIMFRVTYECRGNMLFTLTKAIARRLKGPCLNCSCDISIPANCLSHAKELRTWLGRLLFFLQENEETSQEMLIQVFQDLRSNVSSFFPIA